MSNSVQVFQYAGSSITFEKGDEVMINATEMAKSFNKQTSDWLRTNQSQEFIDNLSSKRGIPRLDLLNVIKGGNNPGTWMHEDVALEFARWLSPAFAIWCNDRIKELLTQGVSTITNDDEAILHAMQVLQQRVDEDERSKFNLGRQGEAWFLTEEGLYEVYCFFLFFFEFRKKTFIFAVSSILKQATKLAEYTAAGIFYALSICHSTDPRVERQCAHCLFQVELNGKAVLLFCSPQLRLNVIHFKRVPKWKIKFKS